MSGQPTTAPGTDVLASPTAAQDLTGRVAVVTGAASGIGAATARLLAAAGATTVCVDRDADGAATTEHAITQAGGSASAARIDVTDREAVLGLADEVIRHHGRLDVWCNVAGVIRYQRVADLTDEEFNSVFDVNFRGAFYGCQAAVRAMTGRGGSVINIVSAAIDTPAPTLASYAVSKAALAMLTKTLATEVGADGIRVNAVAPGFVLSNMTAVHFRNPDGSIDEERRRAIIETRGLPSPLRTVGEPEDIAQAVLYLATPASRFVTGQILRPNGGVAMPW